MHIGSLFNLMVNFFNKNIYFLIGAMILTEETLIEIVKKLNYKGYNAYLKNINKNIVQISIFKDNMLLIQNYVIKQESEIMQFVEFLKREKIYLDTI